VQLIRPYSLLDLSAGSTVDAGSGHAMPSLLATGVAVGDITAVVDYRTLQPFQRPIFYPVERRAFYVGLKTKL